MRDKERIKRITDKIATIWAEYPDMRFFQFLTCLESMLDYNGNLFFIDDDELERKINELMFAKKEAERIING